MYIVKLLSLSAIVYRRYSIVDQVKKYDNLVIITYYTDNKTNAIVMIANFNSYR